MGKTSNETEVKRKETRQTRDLSVKNAKTQLSDVAVWKYCFFMRRKEERKKKRKEKKRQGTFLNPPASPTHNQSPRQCKVERVQMASAANATVGSVIFLNSTSCPSFMSRRTACMILAGALLPPVPPLRKALRPGVRFHIVLYIRVTYESFGKLACWRASLDGSCFTRIMKWRVVFWCTEPTADGKRRVLIGNDLLQRSTLDPSGRPWSI